MFFLNNKGQSLIEILVALTIAGILVGAASTGIFLTLRQDIDSKMVQFATGLSEEIASNIKTISESDWNSIYNISQKGQGYQYNIDTNKNIIAGVETVVIEGRNFYRNFTVENVNRDINGNISDFGTEDPSTQKLTVVISWSGDKQITRTQYLMRLNNFTFRQSDWFGGADQEFFEKRDGVTEVNNKFFESSDVDFSSRGSIRILNE